ncbi:AraC family transcriptional regulator [Roseateles chitinivorans]|uniref:AraC family transcriptional regulator n=1 Tax=Roseateles chitinivorans TaxID=2917965 RepID=UPI003D669CD1
MPLFSRDLLVDWEEPDLVPRPVVTLGAVGLDASDWVDVDDVAAPSQRGREAVFHAHRKGQFLLWMRGLLTCEVEGGFWLVPPGQGIWVPAGVQHRMETAGRVECYVVYVDPAVSGPLPTQCCTLATTPLLRELVVRSAALPMRYAEEGMAPRLVALLLDELALAPAGRLHLPLPADGRLRPLVDWMMAHPAERGSVEACAGWMGLSARTLSRLIAHETGMSFGRWRRQLHLLLALQWLAKGAAVQDVSEGLGYENASNFVVMFRKALGESPGRYLATRR